MSVDHRHIIKTHIMTERTTNLKTENNEYVFEVARDAGKYAIKEAIERAFKVKVESVRTLVVPAKPRRMGRGIGYKSSWKKAIVRLKKDQTIAIFDNV